MRTIKAFVLVGLMGASVAMAAADLWKFAGLLSNKYLGQVATPGAIYCWANSEAPSEANNYGSPCYTQSGGWWWGYGDNGGLIFDGVDNTWDLTKPNALQVNEYVDGEGQTFIKRKGMGDATEGLHAKYVLVAGTAEDPSLAGLGFNWRNKDGNDYEGRATEDLSATGKSGLCVEYTASKAGITVELGWNESSYGYNTWVYTLPACGSFCMVDMPWNSFEQSYEGETQTLEFALKNAEALKIAYKNKEPEAVSLEFKLRAIGWSGTCEGPDPSPIINGKIVAVPQFNLSNRILSIANVSAPTPVQIINMQGAIVAQKTLGPSESLNLANMPTGVYMVRSAKLGISQKIILK